MPRLRTDRVAPPTACPPPQPIMPIYGETNTDLLAPGLYLGLFHGRTRPDENLDDWGANGPIIGPLEYAHTTYMCDIKLEFINEEDERRYFPARDPWLRIKDDLVVYRDMFYGDWTLFNVRMAPCE